MYCSILRMEVFFDKHGAVDAEVFVGGQFF